MKKKRPFFKFLYAAGRGRDAFFLSNFATDQGNKFDRLRQNLLLTALT